MNRTNLIYIAINLINNKSYIGQTIQDLNLRIYQHIYFSKNPKCKFARALNKYGANNFKWGVLEDNISYEDLNAKEIYYIKNYDTYYNGYNSTKGGSSEYKNSRYFLITLYRPDIGEISGTMTELSKLTGLSTTSISELYTEKYDILKSSKYILSKNKDKYNELLESITFRKSKKRTIKKYYLLKDNQIIIESPGKLTKNYGLTRVDIHRLAKGDKVKGFLFIKKEKITERIFI